MSNKRRNFFELHEEGMHNFEQDIASPNVSQTIKKNWEAWPYWISASERIKANYLHTGYQIINSDINKIPGKIDKCIEV